MKKHIFPQLLLALLACTLLAISGCSDKDRDSGNTDGLSNLELTVTNAYAMNLDKVNVQFVYSSESVTDQSVTVEDVAFDKTTGTCTAVANNLSGKNVVVSSVTLTNPANIPFEWLDYETAQSTTGGKLSLDVTANEFANGAYADGTTMFIANPRQFRNIGNHLDGEYKQIDDVDFGGSCGILIDDDGTVTEVDKTARYYGTDTNSQGYEPLAGDETTPFTGSYDGDGHMIENVICRRVETPGTALFGIGENCKFQKVNIGESCRIISEYADDTASLVAVIGGTKESVVDNCTSAAKIFVKADDEIGDYVGGLVSCCWSEAGKNVMKIKDCQFTGTIQAPDSWGVGGIIGLIEKVSNGSVTECSNSGSIVGLEDVSGIAGWVLSSGWANNFVNFANCTNSGDITASRACGGIVGSTTNSCLSYDSCKNSGTVTSKTVAGGICGNAGYEVQDEENSFTNCEVAGKITVTDDVDAYAGGLVGYVEAITSVKIEASHISCTVDHETNAQYVGGVFGCYYGVTEDQLKPILEGNVTVSDECAASIDDSKSNYRGEYCGSPYIATL